MAKQKTKKYSQLKTLHEEIINPEHIHRYWVSFTLWTKSVKKVI